MKEEIIVGSKVKVLNDLVTVIDRIEGEKYYFKDETGKTWQIGINDLQKI